MATRVEEILIRARDTLADPLKERWDDARLLRLLDEGYKTLTAKAKLLRSKVDIPLAVGVSEYSLPPSINPTITVINSNGDVVVLNAVPLAYAVPDNIQKSTRAVNC